MGIPLCVGCGKYAISFFELSKSDCGLQEVITGSGRSHDVCADLKNKVSTLDLRRECFVIALTSNSLTLLPPPESNWDTC